MWKKYGLAVALASLSLAGAGAGAQTAADVRQEDRQAERQNDADEAARAEARLSLPRKADGSIDVQAALDQVKSALARGVREIQFRDVRLTEQQMRQLVSGESTFLADLAASLPKDGTERQIRLRGAMEIRVQRAEDGSLRVRIDRAGSLTAAEREALVRQLQQAGFDRVRVRGGNEGQGRSERAERQGKPERAERRERNERPERAERVERPERAERVERPERAERVERPERAERVEHPERSGRN